ncbi:DNA mismatch endonuclease Vsr [Aliifodinibius salicampi]|uniref:Very short patch repair endonuclease n=1 Tax=Fodinibius salicampi TaxID=1920655 RepID=A0ABT3PXU5_9BACT|nr:DNA mismatch endonuclease Vsr [Fodinibius salicampi]MCW9712676.1 DNA mismatch endonuclease Vsr [Fodinibius salicampi]
MADTHSTEVRSKNMAAIQSKDTKPEIMIRRALHSEGIRYGLHNKKLPGTPDLHFRKYNAVLFVNGCFWHKHDCPLFNMPQSNIDYWKNKFKRNQNRDRQKINELKDAGKRISIIWECALKGKHSLPLENVTEKMIIWLNSGKRFVEIEGNY